MSIPDWLALNMTVGHVLHQSGMGNKVILSGAIYFGSRDKNISCQGPQSSIGGPSRDTEYCVPP
jgi:hypothetical protein